MAFSLTYAAAVATKIYPVFLLPWLWMSYRADAWLAPGGAGPRRRRRFAPAISRTSSASLRLRRPAPQPQSDAVRGRLSSLSPSSIASRRHLTSLDYRSALPGDSSQPSVPRDGARPVPYFRGAHQHSRVPSTQQAGHRAVPAVGHFRSSSRMPETVAHVLHRAVGGIFGSRDAFQSLHPPIRRSASSS